jgi:hypothetical protein
VHPRGPHLGVRAGLRQDLRAVGIVWRRELIRFKSDRLRAVTSLIQPVLFLFVLGTGLSTLAGKGMPPGISFKTFIYPGVLAMSVLFTALFSAASIARGPRVRVPQGDARRPGQQVGDRHREMPRRRDRRDAAGNYHSRPGRGGACTLRPHSVSHRNRRALAAMVHAHGVRV